MIDDPIVNEIRQIRRTYAELFKTPLNLKTPNFRRGNMSDLSLLRGVYADVEAYGTLIDKVIKRLGQGGIVLPDPEQKKLGAASHRCQ